MFGKIQRDLVKLKPAIDIVGTAVSKAKDSRDVDCGRSHRIVLTLGPIYSNDLKQSHKENTKKFMQSSLKGHDDLVHKRKTSSVLGMSL